MIDVTLEPEKRVVEFEVRWVHRSPGSIMVLNIGVFESQDTPRIHAFVEKVAKSFLTKHGFVMSLAPTNPPPPLQLQDPPSFTEASPTKKIKAKSTICSIPNLEIGASEVSPPLPLPSRIIDRTSVPPTIHPVRAFRQKYSICLYPNAHIHSAPLTSFPTRKSHRPPFRSAGPIPARSKLFSSIRELAIHGDPRLRLRRKTGLKPVAVTARIGRGVRMWREGMTGSTEGG